MPAELELGVNRPESRPRPSRKPRPRGAAVPAMASGGGYGGPLVYRQGEGMRPDVAAAFDRWRPPPRAAGSSWWSTPASAPTPSRRRSSPPIPTAWVAPPGQSLHRCATELDLGPRSAYGWLAANAQALRLRPAVLAGRPGITGSRPARLPAPTPETRCGGPRGGRDNGAAGGGPALLRPGPFRSRCSRGRALERLRRPARRAADGGVELQPLRDLSRRRPGIAQFIPWTAAAYGLTTPSTPPPRSTPRPT